MIRDAFVSLVPPQVMVAVVCQVKNHSQQKVLVIIFQKINNTRRFKIYGGHSNWYSIGSGLKGSRLVNLKQISYLGSAKKLSGVTL